MDKRRKIKRASEPILKERYEIKKILGKRSGQQTLLALDRKTQSLVVIKLLLFGGNVQWKTYTLFETEAKTLKKLQHFSIPRYIDYFYIETKYGKGFALVQSYIKAPSLEEYIKQGRTFREAELKQIARSVLKILAYLHNRYRPIIHRDIKPSNILLSKRSSNNVGQVYLVNFGSVRTAVNQAEAITVVGTYGYMSPEQFGRRAVPASDLYGLGTTIIFLASRQNPGDLPQKDLRVFFEDAVNLSPSFTAWLRLLIEPSLDRRFSLAEDAIKALDNLAFSQHRNRNLPNLALPANSKHTLTKNYDSAKVRLLSPDLTPSLIAWILLAIICDVCIVAFWVVLIHSWISGGWFIFRENWYFLLIAGLHLYIGFWLTKKFLLNLSKPTR